jgi:hypothetical protein
MSRAKTTSLAQVSKFGAVAKTATNQTKILDDSTQVNSPAWAGKKVKRKVH